MFFLLTFCNNYIFLIYKIIQVKNLVFVKINKRYINKKNCFNVSFLFKKNDCIFKFNNNIKKNFSYLNYIYIYIHINKLVNSKNHPSNKLNDVRKSIDMDLIIDILH